MLTAEQVIQQLQLQSLPGEGGYFRESYRSGLTIPSHVLPETYASDRRASTAIFYLLKPDTFSALHRLPGDEIFHFYLGDPVEMLQLHPDGSGQIITIGNNVESGGHLQVLVPGGSWQGSRLFPGGAFALMGATMAPGFEFTDYMNSNRTELMAEYPRYSELIAMLTTI